MSQLQKSPDVGNATPIEIGPLKIGAISGVIGLAYGGLKGTLRHAKRPAITALSQGIEAALLGAITWKIRDLYIQNLHPRDQVEPGSRTWASTIAGGIGYPITAFFTRGPVILMLPFRCAFGAGAGYSLQTAYDWLEATRSRQMNAATMQSLGSDSVSAQQSQPQETALQKFAKSKFSPFSILTDEEYSKMLREKMLVVDADIALIDQDIAKLNKGSTSVAVPAAPTPSEEAHATQREPSVVRQLRKGEYVYEPPRQREG